MRTIDKTAPRQVAVLDESNSATVMPVLELIDAELKAHGLEFVITKDILSNGKEVSMVEIAKKQIRRTRKTRRSNLLG